ncbi:MAG: hypothetical protein ACTHKV_14925, partial [Flavipsychrobacter sp.]
MQLTNFQEGQALQIAIAEANTLKTAILGGEEALAASYTAVELKTLCDKLITTVVTTTDVTNAVNDRCLAFFTDLLSDINGIITAKQASFDALTDGDGV